ncbi:RNA polymerase sigma factor [Longispora fulva]|uniref:RNA polymerase sigma factor n=1 Tax=Longispora fulva TaxID=619741 RepID=A0A8J7GDF6_9ACTN|nr:RNA polymerase subunit sigma-70 [Longispora fulva]MBG6136614.1 RNA polymerase sigma-70 factor (ECF subfamily) [Longispora fulva]GIG59783.1 RNA polymerase sigma factor [Longispora fulva]
MTEDTLRHARTGDAEAFRALTEPYRRELRLHCYRIVGSVADAEDLVQDTLLAAWLGLEDFEGRSSVRTWLYRIATNRSLNALRASGRRPRREVPELTEPTRRGEPVWLQPYPDSMLELADLAPGPEARYEAREAIGLALITAVQRLPPRQRAVVVLCDVLGFRLADAAHVLETSATAVKGALQRARVTLSADKPALAEALAPGSARERELVGLFADALESGDTDAMVALLTDDAWLTMPPVPNEYQGRAAIRAFFADRARTWGAPPRVVPTRANGQPALGYYMPALPAAIARPRGLMVLTVAENGISAITRFGDTSVFPFFGLPRWL